MKENREHSLALKGIDCCSYIELRVHNSVAMPVTIDSKSCKGNVQLLLLSANL